ncbi:hypothetical protein [Devosia sp.]|uniref:hypothetical protein n=1 Tax=Devosia sp. TaxID=1871048 RepID=UPI0032651FB4
MIKILLPALMAGLLLAAPPALAQQVHKVHFDAGTSGATIEGSVTGDEFIDYRLAAKAGQTMAVSMDIDSNGYFSVLGPGGYENFIFDGSMDGAAFSGKLKASGVYAVRIYQMGADADENVTGHFKLAVAVE